MHGTKAVWGAQKRMILPLLSESLSEGILFSNTQCVRIRTLCVCVCVCVHPNTYILGDIYKIYSGNCNVNQCVVSDKELRVMITST